MGGAGDAASRVGDFFGETEQAEAMGMLRERASGGLEPPPGRPGPRPADTRRLEPVGGTPS